MAPLKPSGVIGEDSDTRGDRVKVGVEDNVQILG